MPIIHDLVDLDEPDGIDPREITIDRLFDESALTVGEAQGQFARVILTDDEPFMRLIKFTSERHARDFHATINGTEGFLASNFVAVDDGSIVVIHDPSEHDQENQQ